MLLNQLVEFVWRAVQDGTADVKKQTFKKQDIQQLVSMGAANAFRELYYSSKRASDFNTADYSFSSPLLTLHTFPLTEENSIGMRRIDMSEFDLFRLPKNTHFTNFYPETEEGCGNQEAGEITLVSPGEENFYINKPEQRTFQFGVVKGRGVNFYNIPPCVTSITVEATYLFGEVDISLDVAFDVSLKVLAQVLKIDDTTGKNQEKIREDLQKMEGIK